MAKTQPPQHQREAVERIREARGFAVKLPIVGQLHVPRPEHLAYYGALGALAALELIEWPIALAIAAGHVLIENQHSQVARDVGEALEDV
jgi:hypothetical protein